MLSRSVSPSQLRPSSPSQLRRHCCGLKGILQRSLIPNSQEWDLTWQSQRAQVKMKSLEQALILYNWCPWEGGNSNTNMDVHRRETIRREERNRYPREDGGRGQRDMSTIQGTPKAVGQRSLSTQGLEGPVCIQRNKALLTSGFSCFQPLQRRQGDSVDLAVTFCSNNPGE